MLPGSRMRLRARAAALFFVGTVAFAACAKPSTERTVLQTDDLQATEGADFDPNEIVDFGSFTDSLTIDVTQVQAFLSRTPYNRESFLATYQSNGVRAADAIARTANRYGINPLVLLVRAEMAQGLLGEEFYPSPPARVEYVFNCGCRGDGTCDPA